MRRAMNGILVLGLLAASPLWAGKLEDRLQARWNDTWVVVTIEFESDCSPTYTNFDVASGQARKGAGSRFGRFLSKMEETERRVVGGPPVQVPIHFARRFSSGELARVRKVKLKKKGVDLLVDVRGPILQPTPRGPYTLYETVYCKVQMQLEVPQGVMKSAAKRDDPAPLEAALNRVVEQYRSQQEARASSAWNGRERDEYPDGYLAQLTDYSAWRDRTIDAALEASLESLYEFATTYPEHLENITSFNSGLWAMRGEVSELSCDSLVGLEFEEMERRLVGGLDPDSEGYVFLNKSEYRDGQRLQFALEMWEALNDCRFSVDDYFEGRDEG